MKKLAKNVTPSGVKIAICVPTHDQLPAYFAYDLANMIGWTQAHFGQPGAIEGISLHMVSGTYVHTARMHLLMDAMQGKPTYILWLDSDMRFPKDTLVRLLSHKKAMVGANYPRRAVPADYVAIKHSVTVDEDGNKADGELLQTLPDSTGIEECEAVGFGCVLTHAGVFHAMAKIHPPKEKGPFWFFEYLPDIPTHVGEDVYFCRLAREAGTTIYVDHDLSKDIRHIGSFEFALDHTWAFYEEEKRLADGGDHKLYDLADGDSGRAEQDGPDSDDPGVRPESRIKIVS
jgi:hypothetical protein